jgi:hypothetical protein
VTSDRLDIIAHRGWVEVAIGGRVPERGAEIELASNDGRWGLRSSLVDIAPSGRAAWRLVLDRRATRIFATPPVEDVDDG